ncbi:flavin monoamine oxidase family protein [Methanosarcina horonobensis]|uniref:flavin monoamine oxidase family protein n=1 Tax=Methanosarcina horonobensis TaxID=418008 RepID=UPI00064F7DAA|nr:FAD-dependent oxidoreductase [Methanosarcina horonobensis]
MVGGGITGLYTCYKLKQLKGANHTISLFECTDRFGGRIETVEMGGFLAEYGPMRFEKMAQPLLMDLIAELGLETRHFVPYTAANDPDSLFDLTFDESGGERHGNKLTTLDLLKLGILRLLNASGGDMNDPDDPRHREWWAALDEEYYSHVRNEAAYDGKYLYQMGFWNALSLVLSHRAVSKIIHYGTFYHVIHFNPNAAEWIIFWLRGLHPYDELVGIGQGTESLVRELVSRLNSTPELSVSLHLNNMLTALSPHPDGRVLLEFKTDHRTDNRTDHAAADNSAADHSSTDHTTVKVLARHVVLALPRSPLMKLLPMFPGYIGELVNSVIPVPLVKCFFVNENPWWDGFTLPQTRASSLPAREIHYTFRKEGDSKRGMVMVYGDQPSMNYWTPFVQQREHKKAEMNLDKRLVEGYLRYLRANPDNNDIKEIEAEAKLISCFGIRDWSREPFEAGCHIWKAGVRVEEAIKELTAFSLDGSTLPNKNIHICGEAYSDFQGFIEGGLRTALEVVKCIDRDRG